MSSARITGLRSIELGVRDLRSAVAFYSAVWGLDEVDAEGDGAHLRGTGTEHHVVTLRQRPTAGLLGVHFSAQDRKTVDALHAKAQAFGADVSAAPAELSAAAGGGYGFSFRSPEGHPLSISSDVKQHDNVVNDRSRPIKLSHVVLNSAKTDQQTSFFLDLLGFRLSDRTHMMDFVRCCSDHHSIAFARGNGPSLNHMAYEVPNIDGLMRGAGRLKKSGFDMQWGVGRHGPGDNVFSYFVEPNGFVVEYTTEVEQVDEATHIAQTPDYWANFPGRPCRWGLANHPSNRVKSAMSGELVEDEQAARRCEEIMALVLGR
jgi:catechol 2,3-dioxygenase